MLAEFEDVPYDIFSCAARPFAFLGTVAYLPNQTHTHTHTHTHMHTHIYTCECYHYTITRAHHLLLGLAHV